MADEKVELIKTNDYTFVAELMGDKPLVYEEVGDYQGEWYIIALTPQEQYRIYIGSFGSCSGCDWLQAEYMRSDSGNYDSIPKDVAQKFAEEQDSYDLSFSWQGMAAAELAIYLATLIGGKSNWYQEDIIDAIRLALTKLKKDGAILVEEAKQALKSGEVPM